jgi:hypothetical protein
MWIQNTAGKVRVFTSVADPGCLSRIRILYIPDPASRGQKGTGSRIHNKSIYVRYYVPLYSEPCSGTVSTFGR